MPNIQEWSLEHMPPLPEDGNVMLEKYISMHLSNKKYANRSVEDYRIFWNTLHSIYTTSSYISDNNFRMWIHAGWKCCLSSSTFTKIENLTFDSGTRGLNVETIAVGFFNSKMYSYYKSCINEYNNYDLESFFHIENALLLFAPMQEVFSFARDKNALKAFVFLAGMLRSQPGVSLDYYTSWKNAVLASELDWDGFTLADTFSETIQRHMYFAWSFYYTRDNHQDIYAYFDQSTDAQSAYFDYTKIPFLSEKELDPTLTFTALDYYELIHSATLMHFDTLKKPIDRITYTKPIHDDQLTPLSAHVLRINAFKDDPLVQMLFPALIDDSTFIRQMRVWQEYYRNMKSKTIDPVSVEFHE